MILVCLYVFMIIESHFLLILNVFRIQSKFLFRSSNAPESSCLENKCSRSFIYTDGAAAQVERNTGLQSHKATKLDVCFRCRNYYKSFATWRLVAAPAAVPHANKR